MLARRRRRPHTLHPPLPVTACTAQISEKYGLVYVITKLGLLFVYDLDTATAVYRNRISPDPIFLAAASDSTGGILAINRRGQVGRAGLRRQLWQVKGGWSCGSTHGAAVQGAGAGGAAQSSQAVPSRSATRCPSLCPSR